MPAVAASEMALAEARRALGLSSVGVPAAEEIRKQYQKLCELYDPSKEQVKGQEFVELAERKRQEIRRAALALLRELQTPDPERYLDSALAACSDFTRENPDLDAIMGV